MPYTFFHHFLQYYQQIIQVSINLCNTKTVQQSVTSTIVDHSLYVSLYQNKLSQPLCKKARILAIDELWQVGTSLQISSSFEEKNKLLGIRLCKKIHQQQKMLKELSRIQVLKLDLLLLVNLYYFVFSPNTYDRQ